MAHVGDDGCGYSAWRVFHTVLGITSLICLLVALYVYIAIKEYSSMTGKIVFVNIVTTALVMIWFIIVFNRPNTYEQAPAPHAQKHLASPKEPEIEEIFDEIEGTTGPIKPAELLVDDNVSKVSDKLSLKYGCRMSSFI